MIFKPYLKSVIWGGDKICKLKGINQKEDNIGESWEISQVPGHESIVAEGPYKGLSINHLIEEYGQELLGKGVIEKYGNKFPLLVKFIDANDNLSVQVHPNDELAMQRHGSLGKTEMWYIISTEKGAKIYAGLRNRLNPEEYQQRVENDTIMEAVESYESEKGDTYFLPAGAVHAIGAGNLLTEIQESSDITYRIYDYNRRDKDGNPRELHTALAKDAIDYESDIKCRQENVAEKDGVSELVKCEHFTTHRIKVNGKKDLIYNQDSFKIVICTDGKIDISCEEGGKELGAGYTALIPATSSDIKIKGSGTLLISFTI